MPPSAGQDLRSDPCWGSFYFVLTGRADRCRFGLRIDRASHISNANLAAGSQNKNLSLKENGALLKLSYTRRYTCNKPVIIPVSNPVFKENERKSSNWVL